MKPGILLTSSIVLCISCTSASEKGAEQKDSLDSKQVTAVKQPVVLSYAEQIKEIKNRAVIGAEGAVEQYEDFAELFVTLIGELSQKGKIDPAQYEDTRAALMEMRLILPDVKKNVLKYSTAYTQMQEARLDAADGRMNVALKNKVTY